MSGQPPEPGQQYFGNNNNNNYSPQTTPYGANFTTNNCNNMGMGCIPPPMNPTINVPMAGEPEYHRPTAYNCPTVDDSSTYLPPP